MVVLFPAPFSPMSPMMEPLGMEREMESRRNPGYCLVKFLISNILFDVDVLVVIFPPFLRFLCIFDSLGQRAKQHLCGYLAAAARLLTPGLPFTLPDKIW